MKTFHNRLASALIILLSGFALSANAQMTPYDYKTAVFLGATETNKETYPAVGFDFEKRMGERFGLGATADTLLGDYSQTIIAATVFYHPTDQLDLIVGPGVEFSDGTSETVIHVGAGYEWDINNEFAVGPVINADFGSGSPSYDFGVSTSYEF